MATKTKTPAPAAAKPTKVAKAAKPAKPAAAQTKARHPHARVVAAHGSKEALAKSLAEVLAREDEDTGVITERLKTASNQQLLRLSRASDTLKKKFGSRAKLITAIGAAHNKAKDKDFLAKLDRYSLPQLLELAPS